MAETDNKPSIGTNSDDSKREDKGRCLCGAVTFTLVGEPIYNVVCHCENCRRHGGSVFHCASIFLKSQYTLHTGASSISTYSDASTQSGKPLARCFCSICGSKVHAMTPLREEIISIPAGVLSSLHSGLGSIAKEDAGEGQVWAQWKPQREQFCQEKAGWVPEFGVLDPGERYVKGPFGEKVDIGDGV